ncbi:MAG: TetR/AcrR family transcriptional regulator [Hyphomicrobiales bacterium]|nr:TetR/AcrR family transcriptional regulator [Hyphomicrobiales bacterium]MBV8663343.1 TetR/AcrR family transcriptional regulator [Hyphomicrobiales bacterium]
MVQNSDAEPRRRGRPRAYDPQTALERATDRFWRSGYSSTSLDDICAAVGMNRPSLYAAFGDKHTLYLKALQRYWRLSLVAVQEALADGEQTLEEALMGVYDGQLSLYFSGDGLPRGCFAIGTATAEAVDDAEIRSSLADGLRTLDADLEARIRLAREKGELRDDADPAALAVLASATLHTIAIRARAGVPRAELREIALKAVSVICR